MTHSPRVCFVTGVGRSGTTALVDLLNLHPDVCIGMERYKFKFLRRREFDGREFTPARFFAFRRGDTNLLPGPAGRWRAVYDGLQTKYPQATLVGDKIPHLFEEFEAASRVFPEARWIYMLRDVQAVASSWNARASNPRDKWPAGNDYRPAVQVWNRANAIARDLPAARVMIVPYERFFGGAPAARRALLRFLELKETPAFAAAAAASYAKFTQVKAKPSTLSPAEKAHVAAHADMSTYRALLARSGADRRPAWLPRLPWRSAR